jgi:hypothetical protein
MYLMTSAVGARSANAVAASRPASRAPALLSEVILDSHCPGKMKSERGCVRVRVIEIERKNNINKAAYTRSIRKNRMK